VNDALRGPGTAQPLGRRGDLAATTEIQKEIIARSLGLQP
jgi:hypothetical protein